MHILPKHRLVFTTVLSSLLVILSGIVVGIALQLAWVYDHNGWNELVVRIKLGAIIQPILFVVLWIVTSWSILGKRHTREQFVSFLRKDAWTYCVFFPLSVKMLDVSTDISRLIGPLMVVFIILKIMIFKRALQIFFQNIPLCIRMYCSSIVIFFTKVRRLLRLSDSHLKKIEIILKIFLILYVIGICFGKLVQIYGVPLHKPYFVGDWDAPFAINAGINILESKGDSRFYDYGGTVTIPHAVLFYTYAHAKGEEVYYKHVDEKFGSAAWTGTRRIHPVKPIYYGKILAIILFTIGTCLFISLFTWYLLPIPFFLIRMIDHPAIFAEYTPILISVTESAVLAGLTTLFFFLTLLTNNFSKYTRYLLVCMVLASLTVATKLSTVFILLLPLSLLVHLYKTFDTSVIAQRHIFRKICIACIAPYILINPAVILNMPSYLGWLKGMLEQTGTVSPFTWMERTQKIFPFIRDLYVIHVIPNFFLIVLGISASILMIRISPVAFAGFGFFYLYSFQTIANITHYGLYVRLFSFLLLQPVLFIFFPLMYYYRFITPVLRVIIVVGCCGYMLVSYTPSSVMAGINNVFHGTFADWGKESRDAFADYVQQHNLTVYFLDYHHFCLPDTIHDRIIPFTNIAQLPKHLAAHEVIGYIRYNLPSDATEKQKQYAAIVAYLEKQYRHRCSFGPQEVTYEMWTDRPAENPSIILLST